MNDRLSDRAIERLLAEIEESPTVDDTRLGLPARYRVLREIGRGGMGIVYAAEDAVLGREVALKVLAPGVFSSEARGRFVREARAAARLTHPGIAAVFDASERYIAMRLVNGVPLTRSVNCDRRELVRYLRDAALAVHAAHELGVVHRDLKPANILIEDGQAIVTDFGLAKDRLAEVDLSRSGQILGTPAFMAPEQASGRGERADERTDVYGLGATLYAVMTGRSPFEQDQDEDVVGVLRRVIEDDIVPPRQYDASIDRDLEVIALHCLEKDPARRYPSARDLAEDLTRYLAGRAIEARPAGLAYHASRFLGRHRRTALIAGSLLLALAIALAVAWHESQERMATSAALALSDRVNGWLADASLCEQLGEIERRDELIDGGLAHCAGFLERHDVAWGHVLAGRLLAARRDSDRARAAFDRALELAPGLASARLDRGVLLAGEVFAKAPGARLEDLDALEPAVAELRSRALTDLDLALATTDLTRIDAELARADRAALCGERKTARAGYQEVLRVEPTHVRARYGLLAIELAEGNDDAALGLALSALDLHRGLGPAYTARSLRDGNEAEREARERQLAAMVARLTAGDDSAQAYAEIAWQRLEAGDVEGALADFTSALERNPSDALAHGQRGIVQVRRAAQFGRRNPVGALAAWRGAILDFTAAVTIEPTLVGAINNRGVARLECEAILMVRGELVAAREAREAALADFEAAFAADPRFGLALFNRAIARRRIVEVDPSVPFAREFLAAARRDIEAFLKMKAGDASAMIELGRLHAAEGRL